MYLYSEQCCETLICYESSSRFLSVSCVHGVGVNVLNKISRQTVEGGGECSDMLLTSFSVLAEDQVIWVQSSSTSNMCPLLTVVCHVEGNPTLEVKDSLHSCPTQPKGKSRKGNNKPVSEIRKECGPLCSTWSSSDKSSTRFLSRAEQGEN